MLLKVVVAIADALMSQDEKGKRRPRPVAWFVIVGALVIIGLFVYTRVDAGVTWIRKVDEHVEDHTAADKAFRKEFREMKRDVRIIRDGLIAKGLATAPPTSKSLSAEDDGQ